jgi:pSer/pThr/pTyr-binding forkhead associated (FHA) protein
LEKKVTGDKIFMNSDKNNDQNKKEDQYQGMTDDFDSNETLDGTPEIEYKIPESGRVVPVLMEVTKGKSKNLYILDSRKIIIGRDPTADIMLEDLRVSRRHAEITYDNISLKGSQPCCRLIDADSRNGTYVNDKRLQSPTVLNNGDLICFGNSTFGFYIRSEVELEADLSMRSRLALHKCRTENSHVSVETDASLQILIPETSFEPEEFKSVITDVYSNGIWVQTSEITYEMYFRILTRPRSSKVITILPTTNKQIVFHGRVSWIHLDSDHQPPVTTVGMEFQNLKMHSRETLNSFLRKRTGWDPLESE